MRSLKLLITFNLMWSICFGQKQIPITPVYEIKTDTVYEQILNSTYYQVLEDKEGKWSFDEVSQVPLSNLFHIKRVKVESIDTNDVHTYWHRYRLKNTMATTAKIAISLQADLFDVYAKKADNSEWVHYKNGNLREWAKRDGLKSVAVDGEMPGAIMLILYSGEEVSIYDRCYRENETNFNVNISFYSTDKLIQEQYVEPIHGRMSIFEFSHIQEAFTLGLLLVTIFFNFFFYRISKEKSYLYFSLFAVFLGIVRLWNFLTVYLICWGDPSLLKYTAYLHCTWAFIPFFLIQFVRVFFKTKEYYKKWDWLLNTVSYLNIIIIVLVFPKSPFDINNIRLDDFINYINFFCILITFGLYIKRKDKFQLYIMIGLSPLIIFYLFERIIFLIARSTGFTGIIDNSRLIEAICVLWLILISSSLLFIRYNLLKKENDQRALDNERLAKEKVIERNQLIEAQKAELEKQVKERTYELEVSLKELKDTQNQLIQKEKLASLGELTAGIAHEIQNPLNFVNNFSELSVDLAKDLNDEIHKTDMDKEYVEELLTDLTSNQEKINHHGKRASSIVKGMLEHSRTSTGVKELTDINKLADEYLRLSYHGLRAKDKDFNANYELIIDENLPKIEVIPQDMGRVLLNLINNAFYAVNERANQIRSGNFESFPNVEAGQAYTPSVFVSTQHLNNQIIIKVKDNGIGMPESVRAKVFQPFFTTKPTGQGTGLGLSLAYDIVTKGHGGALEVESTEGVGTTFFIKLPI